MPVFEKENDVTDELKDMFKTYFVGLYQFKNKKSRYSQEICQGKFKKSLFNHEKKMN